MTDMTLRRTLITAAAVLAAAGCTPTDRHTSNPLAAGTTPAGRYGPDWHSAHDRQRWEPRVTSVGAEGRVLVVETSLPAWDTATGLEVCQAGRAFAERMSSRSGGVAVYSAEGVRLSWADAAASCRVLPADEQTRMRPGRIEAE